MALPPRSFNITTDKTPDNELKFLNIRIQKERQVASEAIVKTAQKAAEGAAETMKNLAPSQHGNGTGRLKKSIGVVIKPGSASGSPAQVLSGPGGAGGGVGFTSKVVVGFGINYAKFVTEGTGIYGVKRERIYSKPGKPFSFKAGYIGDKSTIRDSFNPKTNFKVNVSDPLNSNKLSLGLPRNIPKGYKATPKQALYYKSAVVYSTRGQKANDEFIKAGQRRAREEVRLGLQNLKAYRK